MSGPGPDLPTEEEKRAGQWLQRVDMSLMVHSKEDEDDVVKVRMVGTAQFIVNALATMAGVVALKYDVDSPWDQLNQL